MDRQLSNARMGGVGNGWVPILEEMFDKLKAIGWEGDVSQIKEKFGILRIYLTEETDEVEEIVREAEDKSAKVCEFCGSPGTLGGEYWLKTLCPECRIKEDIRLKR